MYVCNYASMYVYMYTCKHDCMYICIYICIYMYVCNYVSMYVYMYTCKHDYMYICIYIYIYICKYMCILMFGESGIPPFILQTFSSVPRICIIHCGVGNSAPLESVSPVSLCRPRLDIFHIAQGAAAQQLYRFAGNDKCNYCNDAEMSFQSMLEMLSFLSMSFPLLGNLSCCRQGISMGVHRYPQITTDWCRNHHLGRFRPASNDPS